MSDLVPLIVERLAAQDRAVPEFVVRDAVAAALRGRPPGGIPRAEADDLVEAFCTAATTAPEDATEMPAVLSGDETGRVITALGMAVHVAAFNLDRDRLHVAQVLNGAAAALVAVGAAARAADADGTAAVLVSPVTLRAVRSTVSAALTGLSEHGWEARHLEPRTTASLLGGVLTLLDDPP